MDAIPIVYPDPFADYELLDSGNDEKLERFGSYTIIRPDPRVIWSKHLENKIWNSADAQFIPSDTSVWKIRRPPPIPWHFHYNKQTFLLRPTDFKHVGIFPEQIINWEWIKSHTQNNNHGKVLNLFAYTGAASVICAAYGYNVTHVDSSKPTVAWASENAKLNHVDNAIRWIVEDVQKFIAREITRANTYDGIIMDPPRFGRGTKGEVWKIEKNLPQLLNDAVHLLSHEKAWIIINAYTTDLSPVALRNLLEDCLKKRSAKIEMAQLAIKQTSNNRLVPHGIVVRAQLL